MTLLERPSAKADFFGGRAGGPPFFQNSHRWLALSCCGAILLALTAIGLCLPRALPGQFGIGYGPALDRFVALCGVQGVVYFAAVALVLRGAARRTVWVILGVAALLRLTVVVFPPFLSNDIYRYVWDGWVQGAGINPYRYIPDDSHLAFLRDARVFPNINRADYAHTIYPPAAEMVFFAVSRLAGWLALPPVLAMKLAMLGLEGIGIWAMLRLLDQAGLPRARIVIYAWNPLPVWEFAGSGHVDAIAVCCIALAFLAVCKGKDGWGGAALGLAVLTKFLPAILLPALWRRWRFAAVFVAVIPLLYLPYLGVGAGVFGFLGGYGAQEGIDSGQGIFLLSVLGRVLALPNAAARFYLIGLGLVLAGLGAWMVLQPPVGAAATRSIAKRGLLLGGVLMAGLSPHYPWYYCWLLIPACIAPGGSSLYLVTAAPLLYLNPTHMMLFWPALLFGPFCLLALLDAWGAWRLINVSERHRP